MIKLRLTTLSFLQFFIWGCWLITIGSYCFNTKHWSPGDFGVIFSTMGISALFMPPIVGILADRVFNAEKLYGILHLLGGFVCSSFRMHKLLIKCFGAFSLQWYFTCQQFHYQIPLPTIYYRATT